MFLSPKNGENLEPRTYYPAVSLNENSQVCILSLKHVGTDLIQARRHGGHVRAVPPQTRNAPPQARIVPQRK